MSYIILDLDNCISDDAWRVRRIRWDEEDLTERYHHYHTGCGLDRAQNLHLARGHAVIISTGRPEYVAQVTARWLKLHSIEPIALLMRGDGDNRPTITIKEEHYRHTIGMSLGQLHYVYDDNPNIIDMYKRLGVNAQQVYIQNPEKFKWD